MKMRTATFIGHNDCLTLSDDVLIASLTEILDAGYRVFLNGGMGRFDYQCAECLKILKGRYEGLQSILVIPYLSFRPDFPELFDESIFPEELDGCHYKAAILKRNRYMVDHSELALCYINHDWGGAAKTYDYAVRRGKQLVNLGSMKRSARR